MNFCALLNGQQLCETNQKLESFVISSRGNKQDACENSLIPANDEENKNIEHLRNLLGIERVALANKKAKGVYERDQNRVKITKVIGKFNFGFSENNQIYLKLHEALLLIELNRLDVTWNSVIISVEQAYSLFLNSQNDLSLEEYLVYSHLTRLGYFVSTHDPVFDREKNLLREGKKKLNLENEMIWCVLMESLNLPFRKELKECESDLYLKTKAAMHKSCVMICGERSLDTSNGVITDDASSCDKSSEPPAKRFKASSNCQDDDYNFLDILKEELEYLTYERMFQKFSYISRKDFTNSQNEKKELKFNFDVFLPNTNFKRSEHLANYRILILRSSDKFPTNAQLERLRQKQAYEVPIIIAAVNDNLNLHFSSCTF